MAKKILIINGSPRKNGNTATAAQWVQEGIISKGGLVETMHIASIKNTVNGCIGCRKCKSSDQYKCFIDDDASRIVYSMTDYDIVVFAVPVYFGSFPAQMKSLLDRMYSHIKIKDGEHIVNQAFKKVTIALIATSGSDQSNGLTTLTEYMKVFMSEFGNDLLQFTISCCNSDASNLKIKNEIKEKAIAFGEDLSMI